MELIAFTVTPNNRKVVAFIKQFDLPVEVRQIDFKHKEQLSDDFGALNPMRKVPVLIDGDFRLWESNAILAYLAGKFPQTNCLPTDVRGRSDVDRWLHWQSCHLLPMVGALKTGAETDPKAIKPLLSILEGQLEGREYITSELSVADFAIVAYLLTSNARKFDYSDHPNVAAWRQRMENLKGFQETNFRRRSAVN